MRSTNLNKLDKNSKIQATNRFFINIKRQIEYFWFRDLDDFTSDVSWSALTSRDYSSYSSVHYFPEVKIVSSLSDFLIILCISECISLFSVRAHSPGQLSAHPGILFSSVSNSLRKCPPRGLRRARYILLPLAHDRAAPSSYANLSQISHGISLEIHNRRPRYPTAPCPAGRRRRGGKNPWYERNKQAKYIKN